MNCQSLVHLTPLTRQTCFNLLAANSFRTISFAMFLEHVCSRKYTHFCYIYGVCIYGFKPDLGALRLKFFQQYHCVNDRIEKLGPAGQKLKLLSSASLANILDIYTIQTQPYKVFHQWNNCGFVASD